MRRMLLTIAATMAATSLQAAIADPVRLDSGQVAGADGAGTDVRVFKGIPYAAPPVGPLRWHAPMPAARWNGVRKADTFSAACMQSGRQREGELPFSEDCLYLNVWTAAKSAAERRPVMMWIYGGGMRTGSAARPNFDGDALAQKGVVIVTINYRVGLMGSFAHPELTRESGHDSSGNEALLDMIAALEWIKRNIAAFGGDPTNVTIFGQSSGAGSVNNLMASPLAKGLFHRAISESTGGTRLGRNSSATLAQAEQSGLQFAAKAGASSLAALRAMPAADLQKMEWNNLHNIDPWVQPLDLGPAMTSHRNNDVPLLAGSNSDELTGSTATLSNDKYMALVQQRSKDAAQQFLAMYPGGNDGIAEKSQRAEARDRRAWMARPLVKLQVGTGRSRSWLYFFSRNPEGRGDPTAEYPALVKPGASHGAEIAYSWGNLSASNKPWQPWDHTLSDMLSSYWVNFARNGDPNGPGLPAWPAYDAGKDELMHFSDKVEFGPSPIRKSVARADAYYSGE